MSSKCGTSTVGEAMVSPHYKDIPDVELVIVGSGGDLAARKIFPALFAHHVSCDLPKQARIIAVNRHPLEDESEAGLWSRIEPYVRYQDQREAFGAFFQRITFVHADATSDEGARAILDALGDGSRRRRIFYLATSPSIFGEACAALARAGGVHDDAAVVLAKPLGHDLGSSRAINDAVGEVFAEHQIFRIDHYLGKETVQISSSFANAIFERIWRSDDVDHVQITAAEDRRQLEGHYYDPRVRSVTWLNICCSCCASGHGPASPGRRRARREAQGVKSLRPVMGAEVLTVRGR